MQTTLPLIQTAPRISESLSDQRPAATRPQPDSASFSELLSNSTKKAPTPQERAADADPAEAPARSNASEKTAEARSNGAEDKPTDSEQPIRTATTATTSDSQTPQDAETENDIGATSQPASIAAQQHARDAQIAQPLAQESPIAVSGAIVSEGEPETQSAPVERVQPASIRFAPTTSESSSSTPPQTTAPGSDAGPVTAATDEAPEPTVPPTQRIEEPAARTDAASQTVQPDTHSVPQAASQQPLADVQPREQHPVRSSASTAANSAQSATVSDGTAQPAQQQAATSGEDKGTSSNKSDGKPAEPIIKDVAPQSPPAVSRAYQVDSAVKLENLTGETASSTNSTTVAADSVNQRTGPEGVRQILPGQSAPQTFTHDSIDEPELTARVVRSLSTMVNQRGGVMNMRLDPPELGQLRVQMQLHNGTVSATFHASTQQAQQLLEKNMGALRTALEGHGLTVERVSVQSSSSSQQGSFSDDPADRNQSGRQQHDAGGNQSRGRHDGLNRDGADASSFQTHDYAPPSAFTDRIAAEAELQGADRQ